MNIRVKVVIFDMDGVITNTMPDHFRSWRSVLRDEGITVTHLDVYRREGQKGMTSMREIFAEYHKVLDPHHANTILRKKEELFKKIVRIRFIPGSRSLIKQLRRQGARLALVTGTSRHEMHRILPDAIFQAFDVTVTGNDVTHGKPHPEPYVLALQKLGISAADAVVIENAPYGIASAKAAGLRCLALGTSLPKKYLREADKVFASMQDLIAHVRFIIEPYYEK